MSAERCPRCGQPLPPNANFCPNCGAPVAVPAASERRTVTVVFVDMANSTQLAASLDAERFREVLAGFHGMVTEEAAWLGGVAEGFIGDAVLAVFGIPLARDDDAVRAIRTSLEIRARAGELAHELGLHAPIRVRIGIRTGQVAVGTANDRGIVIGAEVNLGARIQQAAAPGEILVGESTMQLANAWVVFGEPRRIDARGFGDAVTVWPVEGLRGRSVDRSNIAFVDRRREVDLLSDLFERAASRDRAHLVTLLGEPGIGKSRVVEEFLAQLPANAKVLTGRSSPFEEDVEFWPVAQMVHRELGEDPDAPPADVQGRLRNAVTDWVDSEDEVDAVVRRLSLALGITDGGGEDTRYQLAEVRQGVLSMLTGLARSGPVVVVFEDLHEADPLLLDLIEQLVKEARRVPLLVVCVARWEFLEDRPNWAGGLADAVTLWVEQLSGEHAWISGDWTNIDLATTDGFDFTGGTEGARPDMTGDPELSRSARDPLTRWFDTTVFHRPSGRGDFGDEPRNVLRLPGINNWNLSLFKNVPLGATTRLQFRVEAYNVLNTLQFRNVDTTARFDPAGAQVNGNFGKANDARNPRIMQVSMRLSF